MSVREWLIAIGALVILGIVIDGIRRMRRARKEAMSISSGMGADDLDESPLDEDNPELPNGGARAIDPDSGEERGYLKKNGRTRFANPEPKPTRPVISAGQKAAKQQSQADKADEKQAEVDTPEPREPETDEGIPDAVQTDWQSDDRAAVEDQGDTGWGALDDDPGLDDEGVSRARSVKTPTQRKSSSVASESDKSQKEAPPLVTSEVEEDTAHRTVNAGQSDQPPAGANRPDAQEVFVINVLASKDKPFSGPALKKLFEACGLQHGDMDIYHRHEDSDTTSPVQFSVANAVEPGTFAPADIEGLSTPGISFFMSVPGPSNAMQAFDFMLETAQCVVRNLGGELKDERRSVMTPQTVEHCRQQIREYERKQRFQQVSRK
ncbi:MAG: cell division protein ZipA [Oleiphilaceae bacterium]|nr:cell division protein ZipA [Oleiphilaceae bacterium]